MKTTIARLEKKLRPGRMYYCLREYDDGTVDFNGQRIRTETLPPGNDYTIITTRTVTKAPDGSLVRCYPGIDLDAV